MTVVIKIKSRQKDTDQTSLRGSVRVCMHVRYEYVLIYTVRVCVLCAMLLKAAYPPRKDTF